MESSFFYEKSSNRIRSVAAFSLFTIVLVKGDVVLHVEELRGRLRGNDDVDLTVCRGSHISSQALACLVRHTRLGGNDLSLRGIDLRKGTDLLDDVAEVGALEGQSAVNVGRGDVFLGRKKVLDLLVCHRGGHNAGHLAAGGLVVVIVQAGCVGELGTLITETLSNSPFVL